MKNRDMPAYPIEWEAYVEGSSPTGLTKREYFAGLAMQGMAGWCVRNCVDDENVAEWSVKMADSLLTELERTS